MRAVCGGEAIQGKPRGKHLNLKSNYKWEDKQTIDHTSKGKAVKGFAITVSEEKDAKK